MSEPKRAISVDLVFYNAEGDSWVREFATAPELLEAIHVSSTDTTRNPTRAS